MSPLQKKLLVGGIFLAFLAVIGGIYYGMKNSHLENTVTFETQTQSGQASSSSTGTIEVPRSGEVGFVSEISGNASYVSDSRREAIVPEMKLLAGGTIVTEEGTILAIVLMDNSLLQLGEKTTITFSSVNTVQLEDGSLWARIIKPLSDTSLFTIETSDSSAGVRGTAVLVEKKINRTRTTVIDSSIEKNSVVLSFKSDGKYEEESLDPEDVVEVSKQGKKKQRVSTEELLDGNEFISESLKKDVIYLSLLEKKMLKRKESDTPADPSSEEHLKKVQKELEESLPKGKEIAAFFGTEGTRQAMKLLQEDAGTGSIRELSSDEKKAVIFEIIEGDLDIIKEKRKLKLLRNASDKNTPGDTRKEEIQQMEEAIRGKEANWGTNFKETFEKRFKRSEGEKREESLEGIPPPVAGEISPTPSVVVPIKPVARPIIQTKPVVQPLVQSGTKTQSGTTSTTQPTTSSLPVKPAPLEPILTPTNPTSTGGIAIPEIVPKITVSGSAEIKK